MRFVKTFSENSGIKIEYINLSKSFDIASEEEKKDLTHIVKKMHAGLYSHTFTIKQEREDVSVWLKMLQSGLKNSQHIYVVFGRHLATEKPEILGFTIADIGGHTNCGLIEYVVRKRGFSSVLKGKDMLSYLEKELQTLNQNLTGQKLKGIFWEANDPLKTDPSTDCMSPQKRIDLIENEYGAKALGFSYIQGPLCPCKTPEEVESLICTNLKFYLFNANAYPNLTAQDIKNYIFHFNKIVNGAQNPRDLKSPEINKMMDELEFMIEHNISPILEKQTPEQRAMLEQI